MLGMTSLFVEKESMWIYLVLLVSRRECNWVLEIVYGEGRSDGNRRSNGSRRGNVMANFEITC